MCNNCYILCVSCHLAASTSDSRSSNIPNRGPGSSVSIVAGYRLDGPGIKSRWGQDFLHTSILALEPTQPPIQWVPGLSQG
jgi:hypothetical protein